MKGLMQMLMAIGLSGFSTILCKCAFHVSTKLGIMASIFSVVINIATAYYVIKKE